MTQLQHAALRIIDYVGAANEVEPIGSIQVPLGLLRELRLAYEAEIMRVRVISGGAK